MRSIRLLLVVALVTTVSVVAPVAAPHLVPRAVAAQPVSGAFSLGGGLGGQIDPRTGQFSVSMPLVNVASVGGSGVSLSIGWDQARAAAGVDRYGWGAGWGIGTTFVDPSGGTTVYPANGGAYKFDGSFTSRLRNYVLEDLVYTVADGTLAAQPGIHPALDYASVLSYDDGRVDHFDDNGNLVARTDRFGNRTDLTYSSAGLNTWQPMTIVDAHGLTTTFAYGSDDDGNATISVSSPVRSDGVTATSVVTFDPQGRLRVVTDPTGGSAVFTYTAAPEGDVQYVASVTGPAGAQTGLTYQTIANPGAPVLTAVKTLDVEDADGDRLTPTRTFSMDPPGNVQQHNYAGFPDFVSTTEDRLYASASPTYQYTTGITDGLTTTLSTYDSAHRMVGRTVTVGTDDGDVTVQRHTLTYPAFAPPNAQPANYARPRTASVTFRSTSGPNGLQSAGSGRTVTTSTQYDDHGRVRQATDEVGTTTVTSYDDEYGLVTSSVATGADGARRTVTNTLAPDGKTITAQTRAEAPAGGALSARSVVSYGYDADGGVNARTVAWSAGAAPPDDGGGPATSTTTYASTVDATELTQTIVVTTGDGTPAAQSVTTVLDLVSGLPVRILDALGRVTTRRYDAGGRIVGDNPPTGLSTTTAYEHADGDDPTTRTVTESDGHVTQTSYDGLGRETTVVDNVSDGAFVDLQPGRPPTQRTVASLTYSPDGTTRTSTDRSGRQTTTTFDPLARPVQEVGPTGITKQTTYRDATNTVVNSVTGDGDDEPAQVTSTGYDALNRQVSSRTTYPMPGRGRPLYLADPVSQTSYDGIGRKTSIVADDLSAVPDYAGPGGIPVSTVVAPTKTARNPGATVTARDTGMLTGDPTLRSLQQPGQAARVGSEVTYDAAGNLTTITDPLGRTTSYTYTADGRPKTRTSPSGTVTTNAYDPTSGRLTTVTVTAAGGTTNTTTYGYVPPNQPGAGLVKTLTNESGTLTYSYDADRNRVGVRYPDGTSITSDYADNGELLTSTDATGAKTTYAYNDDSTLKSAAQVRGGATLASVAYTYDSLGRIQTTTRGNGLVTTNGYTADNLLDTQVTTDKSGRQVESHAYDYDNHQNLIRKTDVTAPLGTCRVSCPTSPTTNGTYTTTYTYDAYDRLVGSRTYTGTSTSGTPVTAVGYTLDVAGNPTTTTRTTAVSGQAPVTTSSTDAIDAAGQLTGRTVGGTTTSQTFDDDGRVRTSLAGATTTYRPDGLPAQVVKGGATTTFAYWADGRRRSATTVAGGATSTVNLYYRADGALVNDTSTQGASSATASYLLTAGREARTLRSGTSAVTTGTGVGYYLRDRHSSVTALVDGTGAVTNTYAYADYGAPALLDGRQGTLTGASAGNGVGRANAFGWTGAAVRGMYTDAALGTFMTPARFYDPMQGRFTSRDTANVHNRYLGFEANPITKVDPSGESPFVDFLVDALFTIVFLVSAVETGGATLAAGAEVYGAIEAGEAAATGLAAARTASGIATVANVVGAVSYGTRLADDVGSAVTGQHFLSDDQRNDLNNVGTLAGGIAGAAGLVGAGAKEAAAALDAATNAEASSAATTSGLDGTPVRPDSQPVTDGVDSTGGTKGYDADSEADWDELGDDDGSDDSSYDSSDESSDDDSAFEFGADDFDPPSKAKIPSELLEPELPNLGKRGLIFGADGGNGPGLVLVPAEENLIGSVDSILQGRPSLGKALGSVRQIKSISPPNVEGSASLLGRDPAIGLGAGKRAVLPKDLLHDDLNLVRLLDYLNE